MARQRKKTNPIVSALIVGVIGIILLVFGIRDFIGLHGNLLNVSTCDPSEIKEGTYIEATLRTGYGKYIEKTTTYNHTVTKTDGYYYLVDVCDTNDDGSFKDSAMWIGVSVRKAESDKYEAISNDENATPIEIKGVIRKNTSEIQGFLDDYLDKYIEYYASSYGVTLTDEDYAAFKAEALPYYIDIKTDFEYMFYLGLGTILLLISVITFLVGFKKRKANASYQGTAGNYSGDYSSYNGNYDGNYNGNYTGSGYNTPDHNNTDPNYGSGSGYVDPIYNQNAGNAAGGPQSDPYSAASDNTQPSQQTPYSSGNFSIKKDE